MPQSADAPRARELQHVADVSFVRRLAMRVGELHLAVYAAALAYGAVFALVPMLVLLVALVGVFHGETLVAKGMAELRSVLPSDAVAVIQTQLDAIANTRDAQSFGIGAIISALVAIWGASSAMRRVMEALNVVHQAREDRSYAKRLCISVALALGAIVIIVATLVVTVVGGGVAKSVFDIVGLGSDAELVWSFVRWPLLLLLAWTGIAIAYRYAPASRHVGGLLTPGTIVATIGWVGFSLAFSWYVGGIGDMSATWGSVAGVIVLLLYLQYVGMIVLLGALIDVELFDRQRPTSRLHRWLRVPAITS